MWCVQHQLETPASLVAKPSAHMSNKNQNFPAGTPQLGAYKPYACVHMAVVSSLLAQVEYALFSQSLVSYIGELRLLQFALDQGVQCVAEEWLVACVDILHSLWIREKGW